MDGRPTSIATAAISVPVSCKRTSTGFHLNSPSVATSPPNEGFSSPRDSAHTPPGVLTKLESVFQKTTFTVQSTMKSSCICCNRENCLCKKCTLEKLQFYALRQRLSQKQEQKSQLSSEVEERLKKTSELSAKANLLNARISKLQQEVRRHRASNLLKDKELRRVGDSYTTSYKNCQSLEHYLNKHTKNERDMRDRIERRTEAVNMAFQKLDEERRILALGMLCNLFPIKEMIAERIEQDAQKRASDGKWMLVDEISPPEGRVFQVREALISENSLSQLAEGLSSSPLNLSLQLRRPYAALVYSIQLVNLLALIFDCPLPYNLSLRDICLCERWTKSILDTDWHKLCQCVMSIGYRVGAEGLHFHVPHYNLITIAHHLLERKAIKQLHPVIMNNHCIEIEAATAQLKWSERELTDWDIIDGEMDL